MEAYALTAFGADSLERITLPEPKVKAEEVLVRNHAAGVNNIDLLIRRGALSGNAIALPHVLGVEGVGTIESVGVGVDDLEPGDRVIWFGWLGAGGYGPYTVVESYCATKIADEIPPEVAAAVPVAYSTALNNIFGYGSPAPEDWILVHSAAGGVGIATLQVARSAGYRTIALTTSAKLDFVRRHGATVAIDRNRSDVVAAVLQVVGDRGVALSLNSVAGNTIIEDLKLLGDFGQIISFGHLGGPPSGSASDLLLPNFTKSVSVRSSDIYTLWRTRKAAFRAILRRVAQDLEQGRISPAVHAVFPCSDALLAHSELESGRIQGKVVLRHDL
ncbi:zinc-binding alcohol dehydrogenase family protein [Bradyrhizobium lablabi]|uniref:quinone oxidoreductase family protein n=1 Tax=Bradyrhizobium lablabi TaxID=722472 RepID=UPI001BAD3C34|nr:zinc-binding alcohol dehydrogenase family protein [Bradyrhizobium lablabi]MBR0694023.1 zinc-binding alcohol dehydrogenase family protein [Bradyrhizobium lablabi]